MEILLLLIYAGIVWYVFIKKKWLPWTFVSQVLVVAFPVVALTILILFLNIYAPESKDVRVINYVVPVVPRVTGRVIEVPVEPNQPVKKGDVLFRLDPVPFQLDVQAAESNLNALRAKLLTSQANARGLGEQLKQAQGKRVALSAKLDLARKRVVEYQALASFKTIGSLHSKDEQLESLAREAVANNPDLRVAAIRVEQANNYVEIGQGRVAARHQCVWYRRHQGGRRRRSHRRPSRDHARRILGARFVGALRYARNAAQEVYVSTRDDVEFARQSLAATTARSWFTATETLLQRQIAGTRCAQGKSW